MRAELRAASVVVGVGIGWFLGGDVWLIRNGKQPATAWFQSPPGLLFLGVFYGHVAGLLGRFDPFRALGKIADWTGPRSRVLP